MVTAKEIAKFGFFLKYGMPNLAMIVKIKNLKPVKNAKTGRNCKICRFKFIGKKAKFGEIAQIWYL